MQARYGTPFLVDGQVLGKGAGSPRRAGSLLFDQPQTAAVGPLSDDTDRGMARNGTSSTMVYSDLRAVPPATTKLACCKATRTPRV
jgi:hypothetical protein